MWSFHYFLILWQCFRWFAGFHWDGLEARSLPPPHIPKVRNGPKIVADNFPKDSRKVAKSFQSWFLLVCRLRAWQTRATLTNIPGMSTFPRMSCRDGMKGSRVGLTYSPEIPWWPHLLIQLNIYLTQTHTSSWFFTSHTHSNLCCWIYVSNQRLV